MKIAIISTGDFGHVRPYLDAMRGAAWEVHWVQITPGTVDAPGVTVHACHGGRKPRSDMAKLGYVRSGLRCRRLLRTIEPDLVHAHYASSAGLAAYIAGHRPYVVTVHGSDLVSRGRTRLGRAVLRRVLRGAALVNPVAEHLAARVRDLGICDDAILALTFGIDLSRFPWRPPAHRFAGGVIRLVCNRSLNAPVYDVPTVLRAVAEARRRGADVRLSLPATGRLAPELRRLAAELGIAEVVAFGQGYRPEDVPDMLAAHDAYVSASHWDGASLSLMEAMACGGFPVLSDIPANREWVEDGKTALMFPPGDWQTLASLIVGLPGRAEFIERAVRINREVVCARADRPRNLRLLMDRLEKVVQAHAAARPCGTGDPGRGDNRP